jgi:hypothetical protein
MKGIARSFAVLLCVLSLFGCSKKAEHVHRSVVDGGPEDEQVRLLRNPHGRSLTEKDQRGRMVWLANGWHGDC